MAVNTPYKDTTATTTNHTANYDLPLWAGEDTTSWLTQMNDAMNKIDDGMVDAKSKALEVVGIAADAKKLADETKAESDESAKVVAGYNDRLTAVEEKSKEHTDDITNLNTRCDQFDVELHSVQEVQKKTTADLATLAEKVDSNKEEVDGKIAGLTTRMTAVEKTAQTTQTNLTTLSENTQNSFTELDTRLSGDEEQITQIDGRVTALENGGGSGGSGGDIAQKEYTIPNSSFAIYGNAQSLKHTLTGTAILKVEKKNGIYIFTLPSLISALSTSPVNTTYSRIVATIPAKIISDFPELGNLTNNEVANMIGTGTVNVSGNIQTAIIDSIYISSTQVTVYIDFDGFPSSTSGTRTFNPNVRAFAIV